MAIHSIIDLSSSTVSLIGASFSNVVDRIDINRQRCNHTAGLMLIEELRRAGITVSREQPTVASLRAQREPVDAAVDDPTVQLRSLSGGISMGRNWDR